MARYDFVDPYVEKGTTQHLASAAGDVLAALRRKKALDREEKRYETDLGFRKRAEEREVAREGRAAESHDLDVERAGGVRTEGSVISRPSIKLDTSFGPSERTGDTLSRSRFAGGEPINTGVDTASAIGELRTRGRMEYDFDRSVEGRGLAAREAATIRGEERREQRRRNNITERTGALVGSGRIENPETARSVVTGDTPFADAAPPTTRPGYWEDRTREAGINTAESINRHRATRSIDAEFGVGPNRNDVRINDITRIEQIRGARLAAAQKELREAEEFQAGQSSLGRAGDPERLRRAQQAVAQAQTAYSDITATLDAELSAGLDRDSRRRGEGGRPAPVEEEEQDPIARDKAFLDGAGDDATERARRVQFIKQRRGMIPGGSR